jgi:hypothetical protein
VLVEVAAAQAPTISLSANPPTTNENGFTTLSWSSSNASSCSASGEWSGNKETSDSEQTGPLTSDTSFTLTCTGDGGTVSKTVTVTIDQITNGTASLSWNPPTTNEDGTALSDLAGYKIYYGISLGNYPNVITINNPGITSYLVENLSPNTYYFVVKAFDNFGNISDESNTGSKTIQ